MYENDDMEEVTLSELVSHLDGIKALYPDLLSGSTWEEYAALSLEERVKLTVKAENFLATAEIVRGWRRTAINQGALTLSDAAAEVEGIRGKGALGHLLAFHGDGLNEDAFEALTEEEQEIIEKHNTTTCVPHFRRNIAYKRRIQGVMEIHSCDESMAKAIAAAQDASLRATGDAVTGTGATAHSSMMFVLDGVIKEGALALISGSSGAGKSAAATDLACTIASGRGEWAGRKIASWGGQIGVIYVAAERFNETQARVAAWRQRHGVKHLPMVILDKSSADLTDDDHIDELRAIGGIFADGDINSVVFIIDTLSASFGTGDQNSPKDMGNYIKSLKRLCGLNCGDNEEYNGTVIIIHHSGHNGDRPKGASDLTGYADVSMFLKNRKGLITLDVIKANAVKDDQRVATMRMEFETMSADDCEVSIPVMVHVEDVPAEAEPEETPAVAKEPKAKEKQELVVIAEGMGYPFSKDELRAAFYERNPDGKKDTLLKRFTRQFDTLAASGVFSGQPDTDKFLVS